jgi:hypothetical protein
VAFASGRAWPAAIQEIVPRAMRSTVSKISDRLPPGPRTAPKECSRSLRTHILKDDRPRKAIEACRLWADTGVFKMADIGGASLAAHAAARGAKENDAAFFAAHAAGQSVATAATQFGRGL